MRKKYDYYVNGRLTSRKYFMMILSNFFTDMYVNTETAQIEVNVDKKEFHRALRTINKGDAIVVGKISFWRKEHEYA